MKDSKDLQNRAAKETSSEEIDLGVLFNFIGNILRKLYLLIKGLLEYIFHLFLSFLFFLKSNFRKLIIAAMAGALLGGVYQYGFKKDSYESTMMVQPNFGSALQLYKNIDYYNSLIEQEDFERLSKSLSLTMDQARGLRNIEVAPYDNKSQNFLSYTEFLSNLDSTTSELIDFQTYSEAQPIESFKYHVVHVESMDKYVFSELEVPIISSITENSYYENLKNTSRTNLLSKKKMLESSMSQLDSLRALYKEVLIAESLKENSGTNIFLAESGLDRNKDKDIFEMYMNMNEELIEVNSQLTEQNEVINVISNFNSIGMKRKGWLRNYAVIGALSGLLIIFSLSAIVRIDKVLSRLSSSN